MGAERDDVEVEVEVLQAKNLNDLTADDRVRIAEYLVDNMGRGHQVRFEFRNRSTRRDYAYYAMQVAEDRYSAGSDAARATIVILLKHGVQAAIDFMKDIAHHEHH